MNELEVLRQKLLDLIETEEKIMHSAKERFNFDVASNAEVRIQAYIIVLEILREIMETRGDCLHD
jgi:hypothetical protein